MILQAVLSLVTSTVQDQRSDIQIMTSPAFESLAQLGEAICPSRRLRFLTPGDLDYKQEQFEDQLTRHTRARLAAADRGFKGCTNQFGGLSCPAQHRLEAIAKLHLLHSFALSACSTPG